jgi:TRAP-type C4-dicarboxylate transport system permease small subunit
MHDIVKKISLRADVLAGVCVFSVMVLVVAGIIMRKLASQPIMWAYDLVGLLTAVGIALALANCAMKDGHIALTLFIDRLPLVKQQIVNVVIYVLSLGFFSAITWRLFVFGISTYKTGMVSSTAQIPIYPFIIVRSIGVFCLCLVLAVKLAGTISAVRKAER